MYSIIQEFAADRMFGLDHEVAPGRRSQVEQLLELSLASLHAIIMSAQQPRVEKLSMHASGALENTIADYFGVGSGFRTRAFSKTSRAT